ncbi:40S ribosomal protein S12, partial [Massospora cicadina]
NNESVQNIEEVEVAADAAPRGKMSIEEALQACAKMLDRRQAALCVLNEGCTEAEYIKLVEALCAEHNINLIKVSDAKKLGEWAGLCKIDREGNPRKVVGASCVVVKELQTDTEAYNVLMDVMPQRYRAMAAKMEHRAPRYLRKNQVVGFKPEFLEKVIGKSVRGKTHAQGLQGSSNSLTKDGIGGASDFIRGQLTMGLRSGN